MTELEELRMLVEKQKAELEKKNAQLAEKDEIIQKKDEIIRKKDLQIENMIQALLHARKKLFGASTEVTQIDGQMNLFETTKELADELLKEQKKITVSGHTRTPRKAGVREEMLEGLPKELVEYVINPEETCSECGSPLKVVGKEIVRTEVEFQEARIIVKQIVRQVAKCTNCGTDKSTNPKDHFQKAAVPSNVLSHTFASSSLVAHVIYEKFALGIPLSRQEKDLYRLGLIVQRATMAHWLIRCSEDWFTPVCDRIHEELMKCSVLHMDETRIQCNREPGKKASSQSWMWVIQGAAQEKIRATYFHYSATRAGEVPRKLLEDFNGYLITDAYSGYEKVEGVKRSLCWAHVRRYFSDSIPLDPSGKELPGSKGAEAREFINLLFKLEDEMKDLSNEERKEKRQTASRALLDAFWSWHKETSAKRTTNEKLKKALGYAANQRDHLETFLEDGRLVISNNLCESHIRPFAVSRRAWLFADSQKGAQANAVLYTIVESARQNDLDIFQYLTYLLTELPNTDFYNHPELLDAYLPWSDQLPEQCKLTINRQKRFK